MGKSGVRSNGTALAAVAGLIFVLGLGFRVAPLLDQGGRMLWQWPTEDGYLMMTIARNIALGNGMAIADGAIPTNGTQPLATFVWAGVFAVLNGDKISSVLAIQVLQILFGMASALLVFFFARRLLAHATWGAQAATLAAALWFCSPVVMNHTMNGLETGLYVLLVLSSLIAWSGWQGTASAKVRPYGAIGLGLLLGVTFLTRVDAAFLIAALTGWHTLAVLLRDGRPWQPRLIESLLIGLTTIAVASPWLIYNYVAFGSVMPISGTAQAMDARVGANLGLLPIVLLEYMLVVLAIPDSVSASTSGIAAATIVCVLYFATLGVVLRRAPLSLRPVALAIATFAAGLAVYYGVFFGARHFLGRYLVVVSPFVVIATVAFAFAAFQNVKPNWRLSAAATAMLAAIAIAVSLNARVYMHQGRGSAQLHRQVVDWVQANLGDRAWIGAIQSGVVGFFHDRTINLDGKVNPYALAARKASGIPEYVVATPIEFLVDWEGIAGWIELQPLGSNFSVLVHDRPRNLAVLKRTTPLTEHASPRGGHPKVATAVK